MMYSLIGAALIIGLLICFSVLAIIWLSKVVTSNIKKKTVDLFSTYDYILEEKARTFNEIKNQEIDVEVNSNKKNDKEFLNAENGSYNNNVVNYSSGISTKVLNANYRNKNVGDLYLKIRSGFDVKPEQVLNEINFNYDDSNRLIANSILESISFDNFYALTNLNANEQIKLFKEVLSDKQKQLLDEFCQDSQKFSSVKFYNYLIDINERERKEPILRVSPSLDISRVPSGTEIVVDPLILEGFEIETGNKIYDYSIKAREIS